MRSAGSASTDAANVVLKTVQPQVGAGGVKAALGQGKFGVKAASYVPGQRVQHIEHVVQRTVLR